jgi:xanthine/CO dehydrogenase XdhC/CoxF family maturation factor
MEASLSGAEFRIATWLPQNGQPLARAVFTVRGKPTFASASLSSAQLAAIPVTNWQPGLLSPDTLPIYCETLAPPQRLFVLGAGDDARPVVTMAAQLGWRVIVAEGRPQLTRADRFPDAERVLTTTSVADLAIVASDAVVIMTHSYEQDRALLTGVLGGSEIPGYIGLLGASHRSSLLLSEAAAALGFSISDCCDRVWAPVGLDLGGDGAEAIALAVIAEIHAWREGRLGASRRLTAARVAEQVAKDGASRYLQTQCAAGAAK